LVDLWRLGRVLEWFQAENIVSHNFFSTVQRFFHRVIALATGKGAECKRK